MKSYYQLIIKITISEKRIAKLKGKFAFNVALKSTTVKMHNVFAGCQVTSDKQVFCQSTLLFLYFAHTAVWGERSRYQAAEGATLPVRIENGGRH